MRLVSRLRSLWRTVRHRSERPPENREARAAAGARWLDAMAADLRFALRLLVRFPGFSAVAILSLALGIGASTGMYSVVDAVLLRPLPYAAPERLVEVGIHWPGEDTGPELSVADVEAVSDAGVFSAFGVSAAAYGGITWTREGEAELLDGSYVSPGLVRALGRAPLLGAGLPAESGREGGPRAVLVSHAFWRDRLGADPYAPGRTLVLNEQPYTIAGVMPADFTIPGTRGGDVWPVFQAPPADAHAPFYLTGVARLAQGTDAPGTAARLRAAEQAVKERFPDASPEWSYQVEPLQSVLVKDTRETVLLLFASVVLLLLIATANVANLLLARASARTPEFAVRTALGAGRSRLGRQLVTESMVVALAGGALGVAAAWAAVRVAPALVPAGVGLLDAVRLDARVLGFTVGVTVITGVLVGALPALRLSHARLGTLAREGGVAAQSGGRARSALVIFEFALAMVVLVGAGLIGNSLFELQRVDSGARATEIGVLRFSLPEARYGEQLGPDSNARVVAFTDRLLDELRAVPGVRSAALGMGVPPARLAMTNPFTPQGRVYAQNERAPLAQELLVTPGYFDALGIGMVAGRDFASFDREGAEPVAIVNRAMAERHYGGDALGKWIQTGDPDPDATRLRIVGVVDNVKYEGLESEMAPTIYVPYAQNTWWLSMYLVVRSSDAGAAIRAARSRLAQVDPLVPVRETWTMEQLRSEAIATPRFRATLLGSFALLALALAAVGIHGVMAYAVTQRRREAGIRIALGAAPGHVLRLLLGSGMVLAASGTAIGLIVALVLARLASGLLYGVAPADPVTYSAMAGVLLLVASAAMLGPALRATRIDPQIALRAE
ncbi:MAG TPA: ABC transporter permease [Woeseiaceae bacterium]